MHKMIAILQTIRYINIFIAIMVVFNVQYLLDIPFNKEIFICVIIVSCTMSLGYVINDILDLETDTVNQKKNTIINNKISIKEGKKIYVGLLMCIIFFGCFLNSISQAMLYCIVLPLLYMYNYYFKALPFIGNLTTSLLLGFVFIFTEQTINSSYQAMLLPALFAFGLSLIRELIKDLNDYKGDKSVNMYTLPIVLGKDYCTKFIAIQMFVYFFLIAFLPYFLSLYTNFFIISLMFLIEIPLLYSLFLIIKFPNRNTFYRLTWLYKIIIINGLFITRLMKGAYL